MPVKTVFICDICGHEWVQNFWWENRCGIVVTAADGVNHIHAAEVACHTCRAAQASAAMDALDQRRKSGEEVEP